MGALLGRVAAVWSWGVLCNPVSGLGNAGQFGPPSGPYFVPPGPREKPAPRKPPEPKVSKDPVAPKEAPQPKAPVPREPPSSKAERGLNRLEGHVGRGQNRKDENSPAPGAPSLVAPPGTQAAVSINGLQAPHYDYQSHYNAVVEKGKTAKTGKPKRLGDIAVDESLREHVAGHDNEAKDELNFASVMYDLALSSNPYTGLPKDMYEFTTGLSVADGKELGDLGRLMVLVSIGLTLEAPYIKAGLNVARSGYKIAIKSGLARRLALPFETAIEKMVLKSPEEVNAVLRSQGYTSDAYRLGTKIVEFIAPVEVEIGKFVRVFNPSEDILQAGRWFVEKAAIEGMSPKQIAEFLSLPSIPTHIADVSIKAGHLLRSGVPARTMHGKEAVLMGRQWEFVERAPKDWFSNPRVLR
jgi:hypothetical protein